MQKSENKSKKPIVKLPYFGIPKQLPYLKPYTKYIVVMIICGVLGIMVDIVLPLFQKYAITNFIGLSSLERLPVFTVLYILTLLFAMVTNFTSTYFANHVEIHLDRDLRSRCFNHLQTLSFSYFNQNSVGYIHSRVMSDTSRIGEFVAWSSLNFIWSVMYVAGASVVMFSLNAMLALMVLIVIPLLCLIIAVFQKKLTEINRRIREVNSTITGDFNEGIIGARTIKTLVIEDKIERDFRKDTNEMRRTASKGGRYRATFGAAITFASSVALSLVLWRGGILTQQQVMEIGTLSVFISYATGIMEPVRWLVDVIFNLITTQVNIERVTHLLETESDVADTPEVTEKYGDTFDPKRENWEELHGDIEFSDVSFKYPDGGEYIFEHFSLKIPQGTNVAIVGETGAGKSTLVNLVCRFFEPTEGSVLIDGKDARTRSQLWLHSNIGYVLQTPHLFSGTVLENLRYGNPDATEEQVWEALRSVSADDTVNKMEKGLMSEVGEGGDLLSTGEKQLLSFARAILADPRILVLDEATASIDTITEQKIQNAIGKIIEGRTSIVIAHRLSTIRHADIILVVSDGKITERGTHAELMAKKGEYYNLYTRQYESDATLEVLGAGTGR